MSKLTHLSHLVLLLCCLNQTAQAQLPHCSPPPNGTILCDNFDFNFDQFGQPVIDPGTCVDTMVESLNLNSFDTACHAGLITRTFTITNCAGAVGFCSHTILVTPNQDYYLHLPADIQVNNCQPNNTYGAPTLFDANCEDVNISYSDTYPLSPTNCYTIIRAWKIKNYCTYDPALPCTQIPNPTPSAILNHPSNLNAPVLKVTPYASNDTTVPPDMRSTRISISPGSPETDYSIFYTTDANCYEYNQIIRINDLVNPVIENCNAGALTIGDSTNNVVELWNDSLFHDPLHNQTDLCESQIDLSIASFDACSGPDVHLYYQLFLDLDGNGAQETVIDSRNAPPGSYVYFNNFANPNYSGGTLVKFDKRPISLNQLYRFGLQLGYDSTNTKRTARLAFTTAASPGQYFPVQLPHGQHRIKWFSADNCGNEAVCQYDIVVRDSKPPTVYCLTNIKLNLLQSQSLVLWDTDLFQYATDNCTPNHLMTLDAVGLCRDCDVFPTNVLGQPIDTLLLNCSHLGLDTVRIWARDAAGNASYCLAPIELTDPFGFCSGLPLITFNGSISGTNAANNPSPIAEVVVTLTANQSPNVPSLPPYTTLTNSAGYYQFPNIPINVVPAFGGKITPIKDGDPPNSFDVLDILKVQRHILGLEPLSSVYRQIAADVNNSRNITSADIITMRKLLLGVLTKWPNLNGYRFVPKSFVFPNSNNAFATVFPESHEFSALQVLSDVDFEGIVVGDVNGSSFQFAHTDERNQQTTHFRVQDKSAKAGEIFEVAIHPVQSELAAQFTLQTHGLEILGTTLPQEYAYQHTPNQLAVVHEALPPFSINVKAERSGLVSQMLQLNQSVTRATAYTTDGMQAKPELQFSAAPTQVPPFFQLYANRPNPFGQATEISFYLPEATKATLTIYDQLGQVVHAQSAQHDAGMQSILITRAQLGNTSGVCYYTVATEALTATKAMLILD